MKKLVLFAALTAFALTATAQKKNAAQKIYNELEKEDDIMTLSFNKKMLESIDTDVEWGETLRYLKGDLHSIKVMLIDNDSKSQKITKYIYSQLDKMGYKLMKLPEEAEVELENESERVWLFTNKKGKRFTEAHVLIEDKDGSGIFLSVYGDITVTEEKL